MKTLANPGAAFAGDRGDPDPAVRARLADAGEAESYPRAVAALCGTRLLLPVVATGKEQPGEPAELAAVMMTSTTGRTGLLVFTGLDALLAWNPQARPVPCTLDEVAATAVETGSAAILVDLAGPHPLVIDQELIGDLAAGRRLVELDDGGFGWLQLAPVEAE
ncbi:MAG: SseB family protein [Propionicimonas sp.]|uniref:SseB family protein n=1 Tax=Propionicimonas sp. TaxID=1955623 RepID=UPI002B204DA7|nr:SseB family protein [Propionicimonas sp.]MEA4945496.1 SseB family protein [Propionicimonas sp.]MEA5054653.1 SseB family protein [Propionicimonas sp.]MEA5117970.1 SseB family protein [Propionicimonas sp.]